MLDRSLSAILARWGNFAALLLVIGTVAFRLFVLGRVRDGVRTASSDGVMRSRWEDMPERTLARPGLFRALALPPLALIAAGVLVAMPLPGGG